MGPVLFVIHINDLHNEDPNDNLFADDTKIYSEVRSDLDCNSLREDLNSLQM